MSQFFQSAVRGLGYLLSVPERTVRSLAAVAGGTTSLLTDTLFPESLRGTTLYKIFVGDAQRFVIEKVAAVQREAEAQPATPEVENYVQRKMIGGALETAGLFAMHFSPLWVFAIAGDAAAGTSVFLQRLTEQLKQNGVIPEDTRVDGLADLLGVIHETSRKSATAIDTPPMSREELTRLASDMLSSYGQMFTKATDLLPRIEAIWGQMQRIADRQNVSIDTISGVLTMDVAQWAKKGVGAVLAVGQTGGDLLGEHILESYAATLDKIAEQGVTTYISEKMTPFFQCAISHFDPSKKSWTESFLGMGEAESEQA
ncbi:MAG TPA: hypothetical protein PLV57_00590 [Phycisphaerae bacterium]|nr:hypothetical protein [Phycisphaerae bacterium]HOM49616.1 hypothetical protein [Phycisphaerae bacterium]HON65419.1 hypothetical protein [Phycisphaerae bacterium]HPP24983.1 hypothetical protein [Phycisphaerae bacterium]